MRRKRNRRQPMREEAGHDRWLVSYADFITLLFAFFVVLYASAQTDNRKIARVAAAIKGAFQDLGVFTGSGPTPAAREIIVAQSIERLHSEQQTSPTFVGTPTDSTAQTTRKPGSLPDAIDTESLKKHLEAALGDDIKKQRVQMRVGPEGLIVSLREIGFFESGDATLLPAAKPTLTRLVKVLDSESFEIRVEGHTDNVPIHTQKFSSNWELSTARATEVVSMLVREYGFDPRYVSVAGYAEYRPIYSNDTEDGRRANRRIDLVVLGARKRLE